MCSQIILRGKKHPNGFWQKKRCAFFSLSFVVILFILSGKLIADDIKDANSEPQAGQSATLQVNQNALSKPDSAQRDSVGSVLPVQSTKRYAVVGFPAVLYMPETLVIFGGGATVTLRGAHQSMDDRPNSIHTQAIYTLKNQFAFKLMPNFYFDDYKWQMRALLVYQKFPDTFYGVGNSNSIDDAENFTTEDFVFYAGLTRRVYKHFRLGFWYDAQKTSVLKINEDGILARSGLRGVSGGVLSGLGPVVEWDSRDNVFFPASGAWLEFDCAVYRKWMGSDFEYESYTFDFRYYFSLAESHIFALQFLGKSLDGEITFNEYARLDAMRGVLGGRFRDKKMFLTQVEYRFPLYNKFSGAAFCALGDVADNVRDYDMKKLKYSFGFGLRYLVSSAEKINLRLDIGISRWGISPYFQIGESF